MDLESDQMDSIYDTLELLGIDTAGDDYLPEPIDDADPPLEEITEIEEEELVDPNTLVDNFSIDDPVRMYLKEIGKCRCSAPMKRSIWLRKWPKATKLPNRSWPKPTCVWWYPSPSAMVAAACSDCP